MQRLKSQDMYWLQKQLMMYMFAATNVAFRKNGKPFSTVYVLAGGQHMVYW